VNGDLEVSLGALNLSNLGTGDQVDIEMPADLDQFRGDNSHGTVIGRKCLVQLRHDTAYGRSFFKQVDVITGICQIKSRLHTGDPGAHHQDRSSDIFSHGVSF
jgi:hypothetical protein